MDHPDLMFWLIVLFGCLGLSAVVAGIASSRGRSWEGWFFLSLLLSPLVAIILILVAGETREGRLDRIREEEELRESIRRGLR